MTGQCRFQATTQGGAVNGRNHRLGGLFPGVLHIMQRGTAGGLAKFGDVSTGNKGAAFTNNDNGFGGIICDHSGHAIIQALSHTGGQGIYGRAVDSDDTDIAFDTPGNDV